MQSPDDMHLIQGYAGPGYADHLLALYSKLNRGRGWSPRVNSFQTLMMRAARVWVSATDELTAHHHSIGATTAPHWASTEDELTRHCIRQAYFSLVRDGCDITVCKKKIASGFCYTRSSADDEGELLALRSSQSFQCRALPPGTV